MQEQQIALLLMIVVHGETLWSPAPQPMDDDDETEEKKTMKRKTMGFQCTRSLL